MNCSISRICGGLAILIAAFSVGCEESHYLDHIDKESLFAEPTSLELNDIRQEWENRSLSGTGYNVDQFGEIGETGVILKIISYQTQGLKQYAAVIIPDVAEKVPLRIFINGFDLHNTTNSNSLLIDGSFNDRPYAFALPALRGQSLDIDVNGIKYITPIAEGDHCDAFDGAADDVIALMNVIEETETAIDITRTAVRGGSRGGTVALLVAERDERVKAAVAVAGPTNMLQLTSQNEDDATYQCQFLKRLVENSVSLAEARKKLLASSPLYFVETLPKTQLHLAEDDKIVPVSQGYQLEESMVSAGRAHLMGLFVYPERDHSTIAIDNLMLSERIDLFLSDL